MNERKNLNVCREEKNRLMDLLLLLIKIDREATSPYAASTIKMNRAKNPTARKQKQDRNWLGILNIFRVGWLFGQPAFEHVKHS